MNQVIAECMAQQRRIKVDKRNDKFHYLNSTRLRPFSFLILSFNDELHLTRLFDSIKALNADMYVLDSGSSDRTLEICKSYGATTAYPKFETPPKQWHAALHKFPIHTPWVIALDADQIITHKLYEKLDNFDDAVNKEVNGIYFNRKNYYKGRWIRYGGYFPFYMLKMFRLQKGMSDLNENMDHRFLVTGKTIIWKDAYLLEENFKEWKVGFWIEKHNRYSDQVALEEVERMRKLRTQINPTNFWGGPNERKAWLKQLWWKMPRYLRPAIYFGYRLFFQLGFLDGRTGIIFHFLQAFWFRLIVDIKIDELLKDERSKPNKEGVNELTKPVIRNRNKVVLHRCNKAALHLISNTDTTFFPTDQERKIPPKPYTNSRLLLSTEYMLKAGIFNELKFAFFFLAVFAVGYGFNIAFIGVTAPGGYYLQWMDEHLNYIRQWRDFNIHTTTALLKLLGYQVYSDAQILIVSGHSGFRLVYSCLGYGIMSFYIAFVIAFPRDWKSKLLAIFVGLIILQASNLVRFILIALYWKKQINANLPDHHLIFNTIIYLVILMMLYFWTKPKKHNVSYKLKKRLQ